ncbi:uncharacterized protein LAESUDRAFT_664622 [Laetiporus sulphureus 93-53]|uniref:S-adenosyl-L-methionine-dependent methyltransferase n=1 Tax=Laetiporus sulphureus 93-53 TaxID=1314785 RepID=A0A165BJB8_9APHY|nr:uncharacterized protein LAESUDRAFT_664622 [Laetiporus sulphureus 93-53]KZT01167.1 hypothetical protein LAESUDRAFT_664622 [Laetiporus sulphureus 93-53]
MDRRYRPTPPMASLPPLARLAECSVDQISQALQNLRSLYTELQPPPLPQTLPMKRLPKHIIHDASVPDSGYASAEEDECEETYADDDEGEDEDYRILRSDTFEREYAVRWLTAFTARSDAWLYPINEESDARATLVDSAASILAAFAGKDEEEALTRWFTFPADGGEVDVELNDAPLLSEDHTSVGLQSWASSILLAERLCVSPRSFGLSVKEDGSNPRVLELGAGTGLLSIAAAKLLQRNAAAHQFAASVIATDYHPSVLANLQANVDSNFPGSPNAVSSDKLLVVRALDWEHPVYDAELESSFDVILAADVIYHPQHAQWIKSCVERALLRPNDTGDPHGVCWLIIPLRPTGRHEGMSDTIERVFSRAPITAKCDGTDGNSHGLAILSVEKLERHEGVGRADEGGYKLYKIGWLRTGSS